MFRHSRLALVALVALLAMAVAAASASATTVRSGSSTGSPYTGSSTAVNDGTLSFQSSFVNISCSNSTLAGTITNSNGTGNLSSASWTGSGGGGCSNNIGGTCASTGLNFNWGSNDNFDSTHAANRDGYIVTTGMETKVDCTDVFGTHTICYYTGNNASHDGTGTLRGDVYNGDNPNRPDTGSTTGQLKYPSTSDGTTPNLKLDTTQSNGGLCSSTAKFSGIYTITGSGGVKLWTTA